MENEINQIKTILDGLKEDEEFIITIPLADGEEDNDGREEV